MEQNLTRGGLEINNLTIFNFNRFLTLEPNNLCIHTLYTIEIKFQQKNILCENELTPKMSFEHPSSCLTVKLFFNSCIPKNQLYTGGCPFNNETAYFGYVPSIHSKNFQKYVALGMRPVIRSKSTHGRTKTISIKNFLDSNRNFLFSRSACFSQSALQNALSVGLKNNIHGIG